DGGSNDDNGPTCEILTEADCATAGGVYQGDNTDCGACTSVQAVTAWSNGLSHAQLPGSNRVLILTVGGENSGTVINATYGGQALTQVITNVTGGSYTARASIFYLNEAGLQAATSNTFSVSLSGNSSQARFAARIYENVDQANPFGTMDSAGNSSSSPATISTDELVAQHGDMVVAAAENGNSGSYNWGAGFIRGTNQSASSSQHSSADMAVFGHGVNANAAATHSNSRRQVVVGVVLKKAS
ncbi:MAG: hypothetical protein MI923_05840, partial [Phycisphaerales bacterium]|nr:hypothetical protein [Phycisphaerales bacterium]